MHNILSTNEATLPTFTWSASSKHENITHKVPLNHECFTFAPENYTGYNNYKYTIYSVVPNAWAYINGEIVCSLVVFDVSPSP